MSEDLNQNPNEAVTPVFSPLLNSDELGEEEALGLGRTSVAEDLSIPSGPVRMNLFGSSSEGGNVHPLLRDLADDTDLPLPEGDFTRINDAPQLPAGAPRPRRLRKEVADQSESAEAQQTEALLTVDAVQPQPSAVHKQSLVGRTPEEIETLLREKVSRTQGEQIQGNYLAALGADFSAALRDLPGLSDEDRELAQALMNHHILTIVATNPALGASLQEIAQLRVLSGLRAGTGFNDDWDALLSTFQGSRREVAASVLDLASNIVRLHDSRAKEAIQRFESREAVIGSSVAPGVASLVGATIGSLASAGARFADGFKRGRSELHPAGELEHGVLKNSWVTEPNPALPPGDSEINLDAWRAERTESLVADADRLSAELIAHAGDFEWERGRGLEVAGDLTVALDGLSQVADGHGLDDDHKQRAHDALVECSRRIEEAESKMITIHLRDLVKGMAEALSGFAKQMIAGLKKVANSITGAPDIDQATTPQPGDRVGSPLAEEDPGVHDSPKGTRLRPR